jgi:hypothetical protein
MVPVPPTKAPGQPATRPQRPIGFTRPIADAPADCLASRVLDGRMRGRVWIGRGWQREPVITFHHGALSVARTLRILSTSPLDPFVPLHGEVEVRDLTYSGPFWLDVAVRLMQVAVDLVEGHEDQHSFRPYMWHLALLEQLAAPKLRVTTLDGRRVGVRSVREQLKRYRCVWFGRDPSQLRSVGRELCLLDTPSPLLAVLDASPTAGMVRRFGVDRGFGASLESWVQHAVSRLWNWPGGPQASAAEAAALCTTLHDAIRELRLAGDPVEHVVTTDTGRPVRYRPLTRQLVLNTAAPLIEIVLQDGAKPQHVEALVAAAVSEINRALSGVTDGEERRALLTRLYALPDAD